MRGLSIILAVSLVLVSAAGGATHKPPTSGIHHTQAGTSAARGALIRRADLGENWLAGTTPKKVGALTCGSAASTVASVVETGSAISPTYRQGSAGPFVSEATYIYGSVAEATLFWQHGSGRTALACLARGVAGGSTKDVSFHVSRQEPLPAPAGQRSVAYRVVGTARTTLQKVTVYVDVILVQRGDAIAELSWSSFSTPVAAGVEARVARAAATLL